MKKKFIFLGLFGLLFNIQVPILSMNRILKKKGNFAGLKIIAYYSEIISNYNKLKKIEENPDYLIEANNNVEIAIEPIDANADLNIQDNDGNTVLHNAVCYKNIKAVKNLINAADTNLNIQDKYGNTALHNAVDKKNNIEVVRELIKKLSSN